MRARAILGVCGAVVALATAACGSTQVGLASAPATPPPTLTDTRYGPLSAADVKLMTLVRETSLREITTSQWALERSTNPQVRSAAQMIITQHVQLQQEDLAAAAKLGLQLPDQPSADMQVGIDRMAKETGKVFDDDYANTLRQAHGEAFILIAQVRADTRNTVVRPLADSANDFIKMHINVLEKTGDVDYSQLPVPQA
jgi:predicted outer membrane protein